jgi:hypothetical protein
LGQKINHFRQLRIFPLKFIREFLITELRLLLSLKFSSFKPLGVLPLFMKRFSGS